MTRPAHLDSAHLCSPTLTRRGRPRPARAPAPNSSTPDSPASQKRRKRVPLTRRARWRRGGPNQPITALCGPPCCCHSGSACPETQHIYTLRPPPGGRLARPPPATPPSGLPPKETPPANGSAREAGLPAASAGAPLAPHPKTEPADHRAARRRGAERLPRGSVAWQGHSGRHQGWLWHPNHRPCSQGRSATRLHGPPLPNPHSHPLPTPDQGPLPKALAWAAPGAHVHPAC